MSKADNMLAILWLLRSGRRMTAQQLADALEVHVRTVYRCIDSLCASGAPIVAESGPNGGYRILGAFADSSLLFDSEEQKALVHAAIFAREAGYPFGDALTRAVDKLKRYTNEEQLECIERHSSGVGVIQTPTPAREQALLQLLEEAAAQGQSLEMEYAKGGDSAATRRGLDPYGIVHWKGVWYAVGFCRLRQEVRSFRVDRIVRLEKAADRKFERPEAFSAKDFLLRTLLPDALAGDALVDVRVRGHEHALNELCRHWLFGHALVQRRAGEASFRLGRPSLESFVPYFLLPYGKSLEILEPVHLIERMADICADLTAHYGAMKDRFKSQKESDPQ